LGIVLNDLSLLESPTLRFTQRVPRLRFYEDLRSVCGLPFQKSFAKVQSKILSEITGAFATGEKKQSLPISVARFTNLLKLALRLGLQRELADLDQSFPKKLNLSQDELARIRVEFENARISCSVSNEESQTPVDLSSLIELATSQGEFSQRTAITLKLRVLVATYRYARTEANKVIADRMAVELLDIAENLYKVIENQTFAQQLQIGMVFRGTPMSSVFDLQEKERQMEISLQIAKNLRPTNRLEEIVRTENLFTLNQSLSKWYSHTDNLVAAEEAVRQLTSLDPLDSTGHSEAGIFLQGQNKLEEALKMFERALELGPPAMGMNAFFGGEIAAYLEDHNRAEVLWLESCSQDSQALSPRLSLISFYRKHKRLDDCHKLIKQILSSKELDEQLSKEEREELNDLHSQSN
jgi:tetratricopeptide (TPR) repeat protein